MRRAALVLLLASAAASRAPARLGRSAARAARPQMVQTATKPPSEKQVNIPDYVRRVLDDPRAPKRVAESAERVERVRRRAREAMVDARSIVAPAGADDSAAWWREPLRVPAGGRAVTRAEPLRVLIAGGGLAGLIVAAACHAKGMRVSLFEQAGSYAPYGGPIQIQSNALRALREIDQTLFDEIVAAGTVTADRVSGLKIGYDAGNALAGRFQKGDWLVRFDTVGPALDAGLPPTVVVDRPVIQQIFVKRGFPAGTVRIRSRVASYEKLGEVRAARPASCDLPNTRQAPLPCSPPPGPRPRAPPRPLRARASR